MPCVDSGGELTESAAKILAAMATEVKLEEVAEKTGFPLYRVRGAARELAEAGLARDNDGTFVATEPGRAALARFVGTHP
jgi:DNA-binding IclR family transcriptional regulator